MSFSTRLSRPTVLARALPSSRHPPPLARPRPLWSPEVPEQGPEAAKEELRPTPEPQRREEAGLRVVYAPRPPRSVRRLQGLRLPAPPAGMRVLRRLVAPDAPPAPGWSRPPAEVDVRDESQQRVRRPPSRPTRPRVPPSPLRPSREPLPGSVATGSPTRSWAHGPVRVTFGEWRPTSTSGPYSRRL